MASNLEILHAYRGLYRGLLRAVQYSTPARYIARDQIRAAFREPDAAWDAEGVKRTVWFLEAAAKEKGLEHRILKNLLQVRSMRRAEVKQWKRTVNESRQKSDPMKDHQQTASQHYDMTVAMLNKTMGLCLR
ncbi:mitochondrial protein [Cladobotryum mycophilum]|uniref:Mitochondrial protein n=1 Tax=Cladobotryum mycophilum TaxID=491253 RepID=A0ABR0SYD9_9HYPO